MQISSTFENKGGGYTGGRQLYKIVGIVGIVKIKEFTYPLPRKKCM